MADIYFAFAPEDEHFARTLARALEAEGFSVLPGQPIAPGKSWEETVARVIEQSKACIIVWSQYAAANERVAEEAGLANARNKYVPVQRDGALPPPGFRRVAAAQLANWSGAQDDPQFRVLVEALSKFARPRPQAKPAAAKPAPVAPSAPAPVLAGSNNTMVRWALIGAGALVVLGLAGFAALNQPRGAQTASAQPGVSAPRDPARPLSDAEQQAAAYEQARRDRAEEALAQQTRAPGAPASAVGAWRHASLQGTWRLRPNGEAALEIDNAGADPGRITWEQRGTVVAITVRYPRSNVSVRYAGAIAADGRTIHGRAFINERGAEREGQPFTLTRT
ncbi:MAG: toll/interleukin-1 receptor domain-containing protein [Hyphomonadaceae bacterium]